MAEKELEFWDAFGVLIQRGLAMRERVQNHKELSESDHELLKPLFKSHFNGEWGFNKAVLDLQEETAVQQGLFSANLSVDTAVASSLTIEGVTNNE